MPVSQSVNQSSERNKMNQTEKGEGGTYDMIHLPLKHRTLLKERGEGPMI